MNKKLLSTALAATMLMSLAGCSKDKISESTDATTVTTAATTTAATTTTEATTIEEPVETQIVIPDIDLDSISTFEVTSENLHDGVWDAVISNTSAGENLSPQLSWEEVDGASMYVIYMVDTSAGNWLHLKAADITTTSLDSGALDSLSYVGPYPPSGTHDYVIYVFALRDNPTRVNGALDISNSSLTFMFSSLDVNEAGEIGNVISYGMLPGTYSAD